jgi:ActR/RegA family two-component response regulator
MRRPREDLAQWHQLLIVDDDMESNAMLQMILADRGAHVTTASAVMRRWNCWTP